MYLDKIQGPEDVKKLGQSDLVELAKEMRGALLNRLSKRGGHFGPNLGMVEATIALHYVFNSPKDQMVFDVSHQTYSHKMLTGRANGYLYDDQFDEVSGFSNPEESEHDFFTIGHTSTSISLACGLAKARDVKGEDFNVIAIIGDGSLSGGEALEGLNFASELDSNLIIVVNDNDMSIAENHGGLYQNLKLLRETEGKEECNLFKAMGLDYKFVKDGNDIAALIQAFSQVKDSKRAVVVHIVTEKGRGYQPAVDSKESWHYCMPFDLETGTPLHVSTEENYTSVTASFLSKKMEEDATVVTVTAGTPAVMGFNREKRLAAGKQFVDVGIAEETAVAVASGIAKNGGKPVFGIGSTFLQRAYDQISQDLCINGNAATIVVFGGSIHGMNSVTHLGLQDIPMLSNIPNLVYLAPTTKEEYLAMLDWSIEQNEHPVAIKVPGGAMISEEGNVRKDYSALNTYEVRQQGKKVAILGLGAFYELGRRSAGLLQKKMNLRATVINPQYISGIDVDLLERLKADHDIVVTLEDGFLDGGFGEKIARFYGDSNVKVLNFGFKKEFIDRFNPSEVMSENSLTEEQIVDSIVNVL